MVFIIEILALLFVLEFAKVEIVTTAAIVGDFMNQFVVLMEEITPHHVWLNATESLLPTTSDV